MEPPDSRPTRPPEPLKAQIYDQIASFAQDKERISHAFSPKITRTQREVSPVLAEKFGLFHLTKGKDCDAENASNTNTSEKFAILTLNVLADNIYSEKRHVATFELLEREDADIVLLQEVNVDMKSKIMLQPWIRKTYWITDPEGDITPSGLVILSKFQPSFCGFCNFRSSPKSMLLLKCVINDSELSVVNLHLKAGLTSRQATLRSAQIAQAIEIQRLCGFDDALIGGDFNIPIGNDEFPHPEDKIEEVPSILAEEKYDEAWPMLNPGDDGLTYDYVKNDMAILVCDLILKGKGRRIRGNRFDRFYMHRSNKSWNCHSIKMLATEPIGLDPERNISVFTSDHYAVRADFQLKR